jgi:hypothetical protein
MKTSMEEKLLRSGRTTGPLYISVEEPEQANILCLAGRLVARQTLDATAVDCAAQRIMESWEQSPRPI